MKKFLELDPETTFSRYSVKIPPASVKIAKEHFQQMNLRLGKTIFIATDGFYYRKSEHQMNFFAQVSNRAKELDFDVVTNSSSEIFPDVPNIFLPRFSNQGAYYAPKSSYQKSKSIEKFS